MGDERAVVSIEEAAVVLGISRSAAYERADTEEIPVIRLGLRMMVPKAALLKVLGLVD